MNVRTLVLWFASLALISDQSFAHTEECGAGDNYKNQLKKAATVVLGRYQGEDEKYQFYKALLVFKGKLYPQEYYRILRVAQGGDNPMPRSTNHPDRIVLGNVVSYSPFTIEIFKCLGSGFYQGYNSPEDEEKLLSDVKFFLR